MRRGVIALGLCLRLLAIVVLAGVGTYKVSQHVGMRRAIPDLQLSAVYHGAQKKWCYAFRFDLIPEDSAAANQFSNFVKTELPKYATQVTYVKPDKIYVTWQATPHNQCQFVFESAQGGQKVSVKRRAFSTADTLESQGEYFKVKDKLDKWHVTATVDMTSAPKDPEKTWTIPGMTFVELKKQLEVNDIAPAQLAPNQLEFIQTVFARPKDVPAQPAPVDAEQPVWKWMYGESEKTRRDMYYQRRD